MKVVERLHHSLLIDVRFVANTTFHFTSQRKIHLSSVMSTKKKKKNNMLTEEDKHKYQNHLKLKERARETKETDKQKGKSDRSMFVGTFDMKAGLYTPCSNVTQLF